MINFCAAMLPDELLAYVFDGKSHPFVEPMAAWLGSSRRFMAFVNAFRDKIRKKVRVTQDRESLLSLRLELETAYLLLRERSFSLAYEAEGFGRVRSPDFAVTFTTSLTFMVEVTRLQDEAQDESGESPALILISRTDRLADAICSKLGQLLPQRCNILLVGMEGLRLTNDDLHSTMLRIQQRAERDDMSFVQRYRFRDRAHFFQHYQRLSEVLLRGERLQADEPLLVWANPQAKHPLPSKVRTVLYRSQTGRSRLDGTKRI